MNKLALLLSLFALGGCDVVADSTFAQNLAIESVEPMSALSDGGARITIRGRVFCSELEVDFGDSRAKSVDVASSELAIAMTPAHAAGDVELTIACDGKRVALDQPFHFLPARIELQTDLDWPIAGWQLGDTDFADLDGDGLDELFVFDGAGPGSHSLDRMRVFHNHGMNGFVHTPLADVRFEPPTTLVIHHVADFTGDGTNDILVVTGDYDDDQILAHIYAAELDLAEVATVPIAGRGGSDSVLGLCDVDGDHRLDLILRNETIGFDVALGEDRSFGARHAAGDTRPGRVYDARCVREGDRDDVALVVYAGNQLSRLDYVRIEDDGQSETSSVAIPIFSRLFDWDGDPYPDLFFVRNSTATWPLPSPEIVGATVIRGTGIGTIEAPRVITGCEGRCSAWPTEWKLAGDHDFDGDGFRESIEAWDGLVAVEFAPSGINVTTIVESGFEVLGLARMTSFGSPAVLYFDGFAHAAYDHGLWPSELRFRDLQSVGGLSFGATLGDFSGDGILDFIVRTSEGPNWAIVEGRGDGSFAPPNVFPTTGAPNESYWHSTTGDFDGDGRLDVAGRSTIYFGDGARGFRNAVGVPWFETTYTIPLVAADVDGDGKHEAIVARCAENPKRSVDNCWVADLDVYGFDAGEAPELEGSLAVARSFDSTGTLYDGIAIGDLDGDGLGELVLGVGPIEIHHLARASGGELVLASSAPDEYALPDDVVPYSIRLVDGDGDGDLDLWIDATSGALIFTNDGLGRFELGAQVDFLSYGMGACDLDGDGRSELIQVWPDRIGQMRQRSTLEFDEVEWIELRSPLYLTSPRHRSRPDCADLGGDGLSELIVYDVNGAAYVFRNLSH